MLPKFSLFNPEIHHFFTSKNLLAPSDIRAIGIARNHCVLDEPRVFNILIALYMYLIWLILSRSRIYA